MTRNRHRIVWPLLCALALVPAPGRAAEAYRPVVGDPLLEPWRWRTFPELSGLGMQCMAEGADGTMWFGTGVGIWSYDGADWTRYPQGQVAIAGRIVSVVSGIDGTIYVGSVRGISQYRDGTWTRLFSAGDPRFGDIRKLAVGQDGTLWAATSWGLLRHRDSGWILSTGREIADRMATPQPGASVSVELLPESVTAKGGRESPTSSRHDLIDVSVDPKGRVWLGTSGGEVLRYDPSGDPEEPWTLYNELDGIVGGRAPAILPLRDGTIWVLSGAGSGHLNVFDGTRWRASALADAGLPDDCGNPIQTRDGVVWMSSRYVIHAYRDGRWRSYQKPEVPVPTVRNLIFQSADGALWIAGPGTEIQRVDYQTPRWLTLQDLNFHWEGPDGREWFLHRSGRVVTHFAGEWLSYGPEDGIIDAPVALVGTDSGDVWVAGSHEHIAATARYDGRQWTRTTHDEFSWGIDWRGTLAASDGSVWFSAAVDSRGPRHHRAGILQFRDGRWIHHHQPGRAPRDGDDTDPSTLLPATQGIAKLLCVGESADGRIWAGRNQLVFHDGRKWERFAPLAGLESVTIETLFTTRERDLWMGTHQFGALRYAGPEWQRFQGRGSLEANSVWSLAQSTDGSIWAATDHSISRFDGQTWFAGMFPAQLNVPEEGGGRLLGSRSGALWINRLVREWTLRAWTSPVVRPIDFATCEFWTVRHQYQGRPPETTVLTRIDRVSHPGNIAVLWTGMSFWRESGDSELRYSHRLDGAPWSPFVAETGHAFFELPPGRHRLEVRARDRDFNIDPTPAVMEFVVLPPVWRQGWFIALMIALTGAAAAQTVRVFLQRDRLRTANRSLRAEVDERQRAEAEARKSEALYRSFIAASPDGVAVLDPGGNVLFASRRIHELSGQEPTADVAGTNALEWLAPEDRERAHADLAKNAAGQVVLDSQFTLVRRDGSRLPIEISGAPLPGADEKPAGIVTIVRDVSARRQAEAAIREGQEALRRREALLRESQRVGRIGSWEWDAPKDIFSWSDECLRICEFDPARPPTSRAERIALLPASSASRLDASMQGTLRTGLPFEADVQLAGSNGQVRWITVRGEATRDDHGSIVGLRGTAQDITERKRIEEEVKALNENLEGRVGERTADLERTSLELKESQVALMNLVEDLNERTTELQAANEKLEGLDRLKSLFIASMSHELRTPLNSIIGFSSILLNEWIGPLSAEQKENLAAVLRSGKHLLALINDVIDVTKVEAGKVEVLAEDFDLSGVIDEAVTILGPEIRAKGLDHAVQTGHATLHTDRRRLLQCVLNLLGNAVKFSETGTISIRAGLTADRAVAEVSVSDTGVGVSEDDLERLFLPFVRLDPALRAGVPGTGLGLYLTKKLTTEVLQGEVIVSSAPGKGSRFILRIPVMIRKARP